MTKALAKPPKVPCGSCPYRRDVPSGIWEEHEYEKLLAYDGDTIDQVEKGAFGLFMCHQNDGCLCGGWLLAHDRRHLLALRFNTVHPSAFSYAPNVEVFKSGAEAAAHGLRDYEAPSKEALRKMRGIEKSRRKVKA